MPYLTADGSSAAAYLTKNLGGIDEIYLSYTVYVDAALAAETGHLHLHNIDDVTSPGTNPESVGVWNGAWAEKLFGGLDVARVGSHTVAVHAKVSTETLVVTIDGTPNVIGGTPFADVNIAQLDRLQIGAPTTAAHDGDISYISSVKVGTTGAGSTDILTDDFSGDFSLWDATSGDVSIITAPAGLIAGICLAFDDDTLEANPVWTRLDSTDNLVGAYQIDRGRQYELDKTDTGRATVQINDKDGVLDPTNSSGPYFGLIEPLLQAAIAIWNPVGEIWSTIFRGYVEDFDYTIDPSQKVTRLTLSLVDGFEILSAVEMQPGQAGDTPPAGSEGDVFYDNANVDDRIIQAAGDAGWPTDLQVIFSGNVGLYETVYSPGDSVLQVIQDAADAEFPGVSNVYMSREGILTFHGRLAKFDPEGTAAGTAGWDFHHWKCGDGGAVAASPSDIAQLRSLAFNRGLSKVINSALATPMNILDTDIEGQLVQDGTSIGLYGIRSWSAENLLTKIGRLNDNDALAETLLFATYYIENYAEPRNRITDISFRSMLPTDVRASANWGLICGAEISDMLDVTESSPGGGLFDQEQFFIEGVHYDVKPIKGDFVDVTLRLDLSPQAYFTSNPFPLPT